MDSSPPPPTRTPARQMTVTALLLRLAGSLGLMLLLMWLYTAQSRQPSLPADLAAAGKSLQANDLDAARQQFEKYLARSPEAPEAYKNVMNECDVYNRYVVACWYGERAILACQYAPNPMRADLYLTLSSAYMQAKEAWPQPRATEYARRALELDPNNPNCLNGLGYVLADNARTEPEINIAIGYINQALVLLRNQAGTPPTLLRSEADATQLVLANTEDSYGWALYRRGKFHAEDYALAADALQQAINDLPEGIVGAARKEFYYHLGAASRAAGRSEEARHALQVALMYDPQYPDALAEWKLLPPSVNTDRSVPTPAASAPASTPSTSKGKPVFTPLHVDGQTKK